MNRLRKIIREEIQQVLENRSKYVVISRYGEFLETKPNDPLKMGSSLKKAAKFSTTRKAKEAGSRYDIIGFKVLPFSQVKKGKMDVSI